FFFQAEDGIRDGHVTGVQTCALPIFLPSSLLDTVVRALRDLGRTLGDIVEEVKQQGLQFVRQVAASIARVATTLAELGAYLASRSEERRVGKECRCEWEK